MSSPNITNALFSDLKVARRYLTEMGRMCAKTAESESPVEVWLAIGLVEKRSGERRQRGNEVFALTCHVCGKETEIKTTPPFVCGYCGAYLDIRWGELSPDAAIYAKGQQYESKTN